MPPANLTPGPSPKANLVGVLNVRARAGARGMVRAAPAGPKVNRNRGQSPIHNPGGVECEWFLGF
jgi:hypothetical protein